MLEGRTFMDENKVLSVKISDLEFFADPILFWMDGVSDSSEYITKFVTSGLNIARERLISITRY